jgi:hypothetical protein
MSVHTEKIAQLTTAFDNAGAGGGDVAALEAKLEALIEAVSNAGDATQADVMALDDLEVRLEAMQQKHKPKERK